MDDNSSMQVSASILCKGPESKYLVLEDHLVSVETARLCCYSTRAAMRWYVNGWVWQYANKTLFIGAKIWISCDFHVAQSIIRLLSFSNHLRGTNHFLTHSSTRTGRQLDLACRLYFADHWVHSESYKRHLNFKGGNYPLEQTSWYTNGGILDTMELRARRQSFFCHSGNALSLR